MRQVEMAQSVAADLEVGIGDELLGAFAVGLHPFAAGEERGLHILSAKKIDDAAVIARDVAPGFAKIERQRDELDAGRKFDGPDRATQLLRHGRHWERRHLFERRKIKMEWSPARFQFLGSARQNLRRPALLEQALILGGSSFERACSKRNDRNSDCAPHDVNRSLLNSPHRARLCPCPSTDQKSRLKVMSISGPEAKISGFATDSKPARCAFEMRPSRSNPEGGSHAQNLFRSSKSCYSGRLPRLCRGPLHRCPWSRWIN